MSLKIFLLGLFLLTLLGFALSTLVDEKTLKPQIKSALAPQDRPPLKTLELNDARFAVAWIVVSNPQKIALYPNFSEQKAARDLFSVQRCHALISGGFYSKQNTPIGLLISEGELLGSQIRDPFFSGFFLISKTGEARFQSKPPSLTGEDIVTAVQSGPWLLKNGRPHLTKIRGDKNARRIVVALTPKKSVLFLAIFDSQNSFSGPRLADLPLVLQKFQEEVGLKIEVALNLDGGSASAFYTRKLQLPERTYIGSFFCIRQ